MIRFCVWEYDKEKQCYYTECNDTKISVNDYIGSYCTCCGRRIYFPNICFNFERKKIMYAN